MTMNCAFLVALTVLLAQAVGNNISSTDGRYYEYLLATIFDPSLQSIATSASANMELNSPSRIMHYRDGKMNPLFLAKAFTRYSRKTSTDSFRGIEQANNRNYLKTHWSPHQAILFGSGKPLDVSVWPSYFGTLTVVPQEDYIGIFDRIDFDEDDRIIPEEMTQKGNAMNGFVIPWKRRHYIACETTLMESILDVPVTKSRLLTQTSEKNYKLIIMISSDYEDQEIDKSRALRATQLIRDHIGWAPSICVATQPNRRKKVEKSSKANTLWGSDNAVLMFYGTGLQVSTFVLREQYNNETLKKKFEEWKEMKLYFFDTHETIAFHFTVVNGTEPENSEEIFSNVFPDTPLSTLSLLDESATTGIVDELGFLDSGPVYVICGIEYITEEREEFPYETILSLI